MAAKERFRWFFGLIGCVLLYNMAGISRKLAWWSPSPPPTLGVVSYSLYGSGQRYTAGALANARLIPDVFPGWEMWVYHDGSVPGQVLAALGASPNVRLHDIREMGDSSTGQPVLANPMAWRFLVAARPDVERFIVRDIDSPLSHRDRAAVDEWIASGRRCPANQLL